MKDAFGVERSDISKSGNAAKWAARLENVQGARTLDYDALKNVARRNATASVGRADPGSKWSSMSPAQRASVGPKVKADGLREVRNFPTQSGASPKELSQAYGNPIVGRGGSMRADSQARAAAARRSGNTEQARGLVWYAGRQERPRLP